MIDGIGPDAPIVTNAAGAKQSDTPYRFDLFDPAAMFAIARLLGYGAAKYGVDNWRAISVDDHLNHALQHVFAFMAGDPSDDHLTHAACRLQFALANQLGGNKVDG